MSKIMAIYNQKGGVGKTTTAVNLAASLGELGKACLLIDVDPQGNATGGLGLDKRQIALSAYELLVHGAAPESVVLRTPYKGLDVLPSGMRLAAAELELVGASRREYRLKAATAVLRPHYDYILIDCPPSLGLLNLNALIAADTFLIPMECEYYALEGLSELMSTARRIKHGANPNLELEGVLMTKYDGRMNLTQQVVAEVKKYFPHKVFSTSIPRSVRLAEAPGFGRPINYYDHASRGAQAYLALARELIERKG